MTAPFRIKGQEALKCKADVSGFEIGLERCNVIEVQP